MITQLAGLSFILHSLIAQPLSLTTFHQRASANPPPDSAPKQGYPTPSAAISTAVQTKDGATWFGTSNGVIRFDGKRHQYFAGRRYLPDDEVLALSPSPVHNGVDVRTKTGAARIELRPMTLEQKATLFEERIRLRHNRHGMVADSHLAKPGDLSSNVMVSSDNDGLWTAMYGAAECYRYAATKSPEALALAKRSVEALLFLEEVTGRPGFPARSYIRMDEPKPSDGFWYPTADGKILWKADTSSDELVGHFYLFSIAYDLLPDPDLRKRIAATAKRIMDHILDNGYNLIDVTGKPTRWGKWSPEYFQGEGKSDAPLNAVELLGFLRATKHFTGDAKYDAEYQKAAIGLGYAKITAKYLEWFEEFNYSDEELALLSFYTLFRYEKDPALLPIYREGLDQWWKNIQRENNPLWMLIYQYCNPDKKLDMRPAVRTLEEIPLDLIHWDVRNSHRPDIQFAEAKDRFNRREALTLLPAYERPVMKWNGNPFIVDGTHGGRSEDDGGFYLLPYWMGRHTKAWRETKTTLP
jgi:hypothetical protein